MCSLRSVSWLQRGCGSLGSDFGSSRRTDLVLLPFFVLATVLEGLGADLLVVLLEGRKVLTGLGELTLLHALADVPVDEGALGVHEVELVVDARERLGDRRGVGD